MYSTPCMNYPTRTWKQIGRTYVRMRYLLPPDQEVAENPNFTNQFYAVAPNGGLIATAYKPNEIIQVTGRVTTAEIEKRRRSVSIYTQQLKTVCLIPVQTGALLMQLGWTTCGKLAVLMDDGEIQIYDISDPSTPLAIYQVAEKNSVAGTLTLCRFVRLSGTKLCGVVYSAKQQVFYCLTINENAQISNTSGLVTTYTPPTKMKPVSFDMQRETKPGTILLDQSDRPVKRMQSFCDGDIFLMVLCQNGSIYKVKPQSTSGKDVELMVTGREGVSQNSMIRFDFSGQFCAVLQPLGTNFVTSTGLVMKDEIFQRIIQFRKPQSQQDDNKKQEPVDKETQKLIVQLSKENELEPQLKAYNDKICGNLKIYNCLLQTPAYADINITFGSQLQLFWMADSNPVILLKQDPSYKVILVNQKQVVEYTLCPSSNYPLLLSETDSLRIITSHRGPQLLLPIHPFTSQMFHPQYATSEPAHLIEAFLAYDSGSYDSDMLTRILQDRNKNLVDLLLGSLQAAEAENEEWSNLIYNAVRYFKLFTSDQKQKSDLEHVQIDFAVRRSANPEYDVNWVSGGFLAYLQTIFEGKAVQVLYGKGEVVKFSNKLVLMDSATGQPGNQFNFGDYLTDCLILSRKLYLAVKILEANGFYTTVQQLKQIGISNCINQLCCLQKHSTALKICKLFELKQENLVIDYIMQLITRNPQATDKELEKQIIVKRNQCQTLAYKRIALAVVEQGRHRLAMMLLDREPSVEAKVQLNLKIQDYGSAVKVALKGGDAALAHTAMQLATESQNGLSQMISLISQNFQVLQIFFQVNKILKPDLVFSLGNSSEPPNAIFLAEAQYRKAKTVKQVKHAVTLLEEAQRYAKEAKDRHQEFKKAIKKQKYDEIKFEVKTENELEKMATKQTSILNEFEGVSISKVCAVEQKTYQLSLLGMDMFEELLDQEVELVNIQKEYGELFKRNLIGLTVFDTLVFLFTKQVAHEYEKTQKHNPEEMTTQPVQEQIDKIIKQLKISEEVQLSCFLRAISTNSNYFSRLSDVSKMFKKPSNYVCFVVAKQLNSLTVAGQFISQIESDAMKFRYYLIIRQDNQCVTLFRRVGKEKLQEICSEFYGSPGAQQVISRLLYELDITSLSDKAEEKGDGKGKEKK